MKIILCGAGKTGTTTLYHFIVNNGFTSTKHNPNFNKQIIQKNDYSYDLFSAFPFCNYDMIVNMDKKFDCKFILTKRNEIDFIRSDINHLIRNVKNNNNYKSCNNKNRYSYIKDVLNNYNDNNNKIINYFKNKNNLLIVDWDNKINHKINICNFLNIENKDVTEINIKNYSESHINIDIDDLSFNLLRKNSNIIKNINLSINNKTLKYNTKDEFTVLYFLIKNNIKYENYYSSSNLLYNDIKNDFLVKKILNKHNDKCNRTTVFRLEFFDNLFKYILPHFNLKYKNVVEFGPGDCSFLRYCQYRNANVCAIDYDKTVIDICRLYNFKLINKNYNNIISFSEINGFQLKFDLIYGKSSIDISESPKYFKNFISNLSRLSDDNTIIFYLCWIPNDYDKNNLNSNLKIIKDNGMKISLMNKELVNMFNYPYIANYLIYKNINLEDKIINGLNFLVENI